jgi:hypothetical protein
VYIFIHVRAFVSFNTTPFSQCLTRKFLVWTLRDVYGVGRNSRSLSRALNAGAQKSFHKCGGHLKILGPGRVT